MPPEDFVARPGDGGMPRGRLIVGVLLVVVVAAASMVGLSRLLGGSGAGRLVYVTAPGAVVLRDLATGEETRAADIGVGATDLHLAPSEERLAFSPPDGGVAVADLTTGEIEVVREDGRPAGYTPDGRLAVVRPTGAGAEVLVVDDEIVIPQGFAGPAGSPVWLTEDLFAVRLLDREGEGSALFLIELVDGIPSVLHQIPDAQPVAASLDGAQLLYSDVGTERLTLLTVEGLATEPTGVEGDVQDAAVSSAGTVAVATTDAVYGLTAGEDVGAEQLAGPARYIAWSLDGSTLLVLDAQGLRAVPVGEGEPTTVDAPAAVLLGVIP